MQLNYLILAASIALFGCGNNNNKQQAVTNGNEAEVSENVSGNGNTTPNETNGTGNWQKLVMKQFKDNNGQLLAEMPFPSDWNIGGARNQGEPNITGPNGVKVVDYPAQSFTYPLDQYTQQLYYQSGQKVRTFPGVEELIEQDLKPTCTQQGLQFVRYQEYPEVAKVDQWYSDQLFKAMPTQTTTKAIASEWKMSDGTPVFILLRVNISQTSSMQNWYYMTSVLKADKDYFAQAVKQLVFSISSTRYALAPIQQYNQQEAQRVGQSWAAFNQRMAQNQAAFEAQQRAHINKTNAINDAIMSNYNNRMASMDKNQEQFVDMIREERNVVNSNTGQQYKVESHYNNYWMNNNGEYISTNQNDYNPNLDDNMNNQKWEELKKVD